MAETFCDAISAKGNVCNERRCKLPIYNIFIHRGLNGGTITMLVHSLHMSVPDFKSALKIRTNIAAEEQRLNFASKQLEDNRCLSDYGIENCSTLFLVLRQYTRREKAITFTSLPDALTGDDDPDIIRGRMSCGHAVDPENLYQYGKVLLEQGKPTFVCPAMLHEGKLKSSPICCNKEWPYSEFRRMALLTPQECATFEKRLAELFIFDSLCVKICPKCHSYVAREPPYEKRIVCVNCCRDPKLNKIDKDEHSFCWYCLNPWKGSFKQDKDCLNHVGQEESTKS
eukprot:jgi/Mesen1/9333/ME000061S08774